MKNVPTILLLLAATAAHGEGVLTLEERDLDNRSRVIDRGVGIVDINSTILLQVDKAALRAELARHFPQTPADEIRTVRLIQQQVREGLEALPEMGKALRDWSDPAGRTREKSVVLEAAVGRVANAATPILIYATRQSPELEAEIEKRLANLPSMTESYAAVFEAAAVYVSRLAAEVDKRLTEQGIYLQMGAWLDYAGATTPIHLPGFDTLPEAEFSEIERWQLAALLSPENRELFDAAQRTARDINSRQKSVAELFKDSLPEAVVNVAKADQQCLRQLDDPLRALQGAGDAALEQLRSEIDGMRRAGEEFIDFARTLQARYGNVRLASIGDVPTLYSSVRADVDDLRTRANDLKGRLERLQGRLVTISSTLAAQSRSAVDQFSAKARECADGIVAHLGDLKGFVNVLLNGREIGTGSLEYSDKVLKHDIGNLPERAELDLRRSGARDAGAGAIVRMSAGRADGAIVSLEERRLRLYRILTYVDVAVSLIFADPRDATGSSSRFQAAPSYSVLLKRGRRSSTFWNELFQPGIGVNIAALDFNSDESFEAGLGVVFSAFRDYLQAGYGYNFQADTAYWFVGLRFPLPGSASGPRP
jgi:hypothetical protein